MDTLRRWLLAALTFPECLVIQQPLKRSKEPLETFSRMQECAKSRERDYFELTINLANPESLGIDTVKQYSGYLKDHHNDKRLFYWLFESRNDAENDPVILWLTGGPGCSSMMGLFLEMGPSIVREDRQPHHNAFSWNNRATVIFLDQPAGVGYSFCRTRSLNCADAEGRAIHNTTAAMADVHTFLIRFYQEFPQYASLPLHIAGESYAGHYIPVLASQIITRGIGAELRSIMIGNGLVDPYTQYQYYRPMACGDGGKPAVLNHRECLRMDAALPHCLSLIESCYKSHERQDCLNATIYCNAALLDPYDRTGRSPYDVRAKCTGGSERYCYEEMGWIEAWLNQTRVMGALGVQIRSFEGCNSDVNEAFYFGGDWMQPIHELMPKILESVQVLIYAGDADYLCNWLGVSAWTEALKWQHQHRFQMATKLPLKRRSDSVTIGTHKSAANLMFVRMFDGGHLLPYDQPQASWEMIDRWLNGEWVDSED